MPAKITTSVWFGDEATTPRQSDPGTILVRFGLSRSGMLAAPPRLVTPNPPPSVKAEIDELIAAIERCQPYDLLPGSKYDQWKDVLMGILIEQRSLPPNAPSRPRSEKRHIAPPFDERAEATEDSRLLSSAE